MVITFEHLLAITETLFFLRAADRPKMIGENGGTKC